MRKIYISYYINKNNKQKNKNIYLLFLLLLIVSLPLLSYGLLHTANIFQPIILFIKSQPVGVLGYTFMVLFFYVLLNILELIDIIIKFPQAALISKNEDIKPKIAESREEKSTESISITKVNKKVRVLQVDYSEKPVVKTQQNPELFHQKAEEIQTMIDAGVLENIDQLKELVETFILMRQGLYDKQPGIMNSEDVPEQNKPEQINEGIKDKKKSESETIKTQEKTQENKVIERPLKPSALNKKKQLMEAVENNEEVEDETEKETIFNGIDQAIFNVSKPKEEN